MAVQKNSKQDPQFEAHATTYDSFIRFSQIGTLACLNIVLCLMLHTFGEGFFVKWLVGVGGIFAMIVATGIGLASKSASWRPNAILLIGFGLIAIFAFAG